MTLREMVESIGIDEDPMGCAFVIAAYLRTADQREPSTFEGECATLVRATEAYGRMDDPAAVRRFLEAFSGVADIPVPDAFWLSIADADPEE